MSPQTSSIRKTPNKVSGNRYSANKRPANRRSGNIPQINSAPLDIRSLAQSLSKESTTESICSSSLPFDESTWFSNESNCLIDISTLRFLQEHSALHNQSVETTKTLSSPGQITKHLLDWINLDEEKITPMPKITKSPPYTLLYNAPIKTDLGEESIMSKESIPTFYQVSFVAMLCLFLISIVLYLYSVLCGIFLINPWYLLMTAVGSLGLSIVIIMLIQDWRNILQNEKRKI